MVKEKEIVCKVRTQQAENFDEEVKSLVSAWLSLSLHHSSLSSLWPPKRQRNTAAIVRIETSDEETKRKKGAQGLTVRPLGSS